MFIIQEILLYKIIQFLQIILFTQLVLAGLGLHCRADFFPLAAERGGCHRLVAVRCLLIAVASLGAQAVGRPVSSCDSLP